MGGFTESVVEAAALDWLQAIGWQMAHGPEVAPDTLPAERRDCGEVVLAQRLRDVRSGRRRQEDREAGT
jgi:type I restriction enzyme R subunit